jgi:hypothetical protein
MIPAAHIVGLAMLIGIWSANQIDSYVGVTRFGVVGRVPHPGDIYFFLVAVLCGLIVGLVVITMVIAWFIWMEDGRGRRPYNDTLVNLTNAFLLRRFFPFVAGRRVDWDMGPFKIADVLVLTPQRRWLAGALALVSFGLLAIGFAPWITGAGFVAAAVLFGVIGWRTRHRDTMLNHVVDGGLRFAIYVAATRAYLTSDGIDGVTASDALPLLMLAIALWWLVVWLKSAPERIDRRLDVF